MNLTVKLYTANSKSTVLLNFNLIHRIESTILSFIDSFSHSDVKARFFVMRGNLLYGKQNRLNQYKYMVFPRYKSNAQTHRAVFILP